MTNDIPQPQAVLESNGESCATLTPIMKDRISELASGDILEVRTDDPSSREGVPAWSRLTGHALVASVEDGGDRLRFFIRKK